MIKRFVDKVVRSRKAREVKKLQPLVDEINQQFEGLSSLSDEALKGKTEEFKGRLAANTKEFERRQRG